jgi:hypothetical protein
VGILQHVVRRDQDSAANAFGELEDFLHRHGDQSRLIL